MVQIFLILPKYFRYGCLYIIWIISSLFSKSNFKLVLTNVLIVTICEEKVMSYYCVTAVCIYFLGGKTIILLQIVGLKTSLLACKLWIVSSHWDIFLGSLISTMRWIIIFFQTLTYRVAKYYFCNLYLMHVFSFLFPLHFFFKFHWSPMLI